MNYANCQHDKILLRTDYNGNDYYNRINYTSVEYYACFKCKSIFTCFYFESIVNLGLFEVQKNSLYSKDYYDKIYVGYRICDKMYEEQHGYTFGICESLLFAVIIGINIFGGFYDEYNDEYRYDAKKSLTSHDLDLIRSCDRNLDYFFTMIKKVHLSSNVNCMYRSLMEKLYNNKKRNILITEDLINYQFIPNGKHEICIKHIPFEFYKDITEFEIRKLNEKLNLYSYGYMCNDIKKIIIQYALGLNKLIDQNNTVNEINKLINNILTC